MNKARNTMPNGNTNGNNRMNGNMNNRNNITPNGMNGSVLGGRDTNGGALRGSLAEQIRALCFVKVELELYLDTHGDDMEAFEMYQTFLALKQEAHQRYVKMCGPITQCDMLGMKDYAWLNNPWPWEFQPRMEV